MSGARLEPIFVGLFQTLGKRVIDEPTVLEEVEDLDEKSLVKWNKMGNWCIK